MRTEQMGTTGTVAHAVDRDTLKAHIRALATLDEVEAPVLSCYAGRDSIRDGLWPLESRLRAIRKVLARKEREPFEEALGRIREFLANEVRPAARSVAAFARGGERPFFLGLDFQVPIPDRVSVDSMPHIAPLVGLKDTRYRYVVLIATEESARILEISFGAVTRDLWAERPELRERVGRAWTRSRYQNHRRERGERFLKEKIDILDEVVSAAGHSHIILAGSPHLTARVRNRLPRHLAERVIDVMPAAKDAKIEDVVAATLSSFIEREERESLDAVADLAKNLRRGGLATAGTRLTIEALRGAQVDVLVIASAYQPPTGWSCMRCDWLDARPASPGACPECGATGVRTLDLREAMIKLAERSSAEVEFVPHSDSLMDLGGIGCLLRYPTPAPRD